MSDYTYYPSPIVGGSPIKAWLGDGAVPLEDVANSERSFPEKWIAPNRIDVTDEFVDYARPLIGEDWVSVPMVNGRQRFARLTPTFAKKHGAT